MSYKKICRPDFTLRDYQQDAKERIFSQWDSVNSVMYQMPTGTGKTRLFTSMIRDISLNALQEHRRRGILILAHRTELIEQIDDSLNKYRIPHGIIAGAFKDRRDLMQQVQVASIQTITHPYNKQLAHAFNANYVIIDEAHHAAANSYTKLWELYPEAKILGVTATPWRMDGRGFHKNFDTLLLSMSIKEFMNKGWLAPYKYYSVPFDSELCHRIGEIKEFGVDGDYKTTALEDIMDTGRIRAQLLNSYMNFVHGKKGIIYSISRIHSKNICHQFREAGIRIADIDSLTPAPLRKQLVQDFKHGELDIIVNVDIFSEGFDCPDLEFVQLARPTRSLVKYIQQVGRGLRKNGDKQCIILDNVGMYGNFGLPDDDRPWEQYFDGTLQEEAPVKKNDRKLYIIGEDTRHQDLSEGESQMVLIQNVEINSKEYQPQEPPESNEAQSEVRSNTIFAKYQVYENASEFGIINIRNEQRQPLYKGKLRNSISLKTIKSSGAVRKCTIVSSYNRETKASINDVIIGTIYKDNMSLSFESADKSLRVGISI